MGQRALYRQQLKPLLAANGSAEALERELLSHCNLPGPRGNLELAWALGDLFEAGGSRAQWELLLAWSALGAQQAPTNDPHEFLPFCALQALGAWYTCATPEEQGVIAARLRLGANDSRWRLREGVAFAFQRIATRDWATARDLLSGWLRDATPLEQRAIMASLADGPVLAEAAHAAFALESADDVLRRVEHMPPTARRDEGYRVLRQGLEYCLSVFVAALPEPGFAFLRRWAHSPDLDIRRILRANLKKARLAKPYAAEVGAVEALLSAQGNS